MSPKIANFPTFPKMLTNKRFECTFLILGLLLAASVAIPTYLTYHYGWGPVGQGTSSKNFMTWFYFKPWNRFSPYMVGILLGYILHVTKSKPFKMPQVTRFS